MNRLAKPLLAGTMLALSVPALAEAPAAAPAAPILALPDFPLDLSALNAPAAAPIAAQAVSLRSLGELSSKTAKLGDPVAFEVADNVVVDGKLVIAAGSRAFGEVSQVQRKRGWGKPGRVEARILYVLAGDERVALDGTIATTGESRKKKAIRTSLLIAPFCGFWIHGRDAIRPAATVATAFLPGETALALAARTVPAPILASATPVAPPALASAASVAPSAPFTTSEAPLAGLLVTASYAQPAADQPLATPAFVTGDILR
jgi:hypothetical protein